MDGPNFIVEYLDPEAFGGAHLPAGLPLLTVGRRMVAVVVAYARHLQKASAAVGTSFGDKTSLQALHQLHIEEIYQSAKVQLLHQLMVVLINLHHSWRFPTHAAYKGIQTVFIDLLGQRNLPLAFLFSKAVRWNASVKNQEYLS